MKILWITNTIFPAPSKALGTPVSVVGGWMFGLAEQLVSDDEVQLAVATVYPGDDTKIFDLDNIRYYLLPARPSQGYPQHLEPLWQKICGDFLPDIVHIHGTENLHGLACMRACPDANYVVSIQGLVSVIADYFYAGMTTLEILKNITVRDILRRDTLLHGKKSFVARGILEEEYIKRTRHVIGRTMWDHAHVKSINRSVSYHFCNEILRAGFYTSKKWDIETKTDHAIFLSQASYPVKGLHQVLKAVALLKKDFPRIMVRVAGSTLINTSGFRGKMKRTGYGSYINGLIGNLNLHDHVQFTGPLSAENMISEYLHAHLFICPSSIENSPNSLGEAQLLGVPCIASYVGGVPDMVEHGKTGLLYRFEETRMLAEHIRFIFEDSAAATNISNASIKVATGRHDRSENSLRTLTIYRSVRRQKK